MFGCRSKSEGRGGGRGGSPEGMEEILDGDGFYGLILLSALMMTLLDT